MFGFGSDQRFIQLHHQVISFIDYTVYTYGVTKCFVYLTVCPRPAATRSRHGRTTDTPLAAGAPAHHVQVVRIDARCSL